MMGYIRDHAIIVVGTYGDFLAKAHAKAREIFPVVSGVCRGVVNGCESFMVPPDGSKEGWEDSELGDARRTAFVAYLTAQKYNDGSSPLQWVEVRVGDDEHELLIERNYLDGYDEMLAASEAEAAS